MGCPEFEYKMMLRYIALQLIRASDYPKEHIFISSAKICEADIAELEEAIKTAYPNNVNYKLFMAGVGMSYYMENANADALNAGAGMIEKVYQLLEIAYPQEKEEEI